MMAGEVARRVALVTGANRGIGLEVCRQLGARGWRVLLGARDYEKGEAAARRIGGDVSAVALNVDDPDAPFRLSAEIGPVDVLINNAGVHYDTWETALKPDWRIVREAFETNLFGAWRMAQAFAPEMRARGWGRIVNVSSGAGSLATDGRRDAGLCDVEGGAQRADPSPCRRARGKRRAHQRRLSRLGRNRHGRRRRTAGRRRRGERAVRGRLAGRRADGRLLPRRTAGRLVSAFAGRADAVNSPSGEGVLGRTPYIPRLPICT
jgi:short chain dehydrogenase